MSVTKPIVEINDLCFSTGGQDILHNINLSVLPGDFISIIGPNGGGKTTLLKLVLGLLKPSKGTIRINGGPPGAANTTIGYVPQHINHNLRFPATALDVVLMGAHQPNRRFSARNPSELRQRALAILEQLGVAECAGRKIVALSGGQRQRILIARALVCRPELLVLDEPTASIDTKGQTEFYNLLKELNKELTILMVSHDLLVVSSYAKSIACLNRCLHYHRSFSSSRDVLDAFYSCSCSVEELCPVSVIVQQQPLNIIREGAPRD